MSTLTARLARYLPCADQIVVLVDGHLTQIGSFDDLNEQEGYVHSLSIQQTCTKIERPYSWDKEDNKKNTSTVLSKKATEKHAERLVGTRDKSVYTFYLRPIGILKCMVLLFAVITLAFATRFQRKPIYLPIIPMCSDL